ncbi:hypothetical protein NQZ68_024596 [Dissostichus eleginoides]|nr:hypothetical protein NQZ68_024596 [Dissostichus eleginoides]
MKENWSLRPLLVLDHQYLYKPIIMSPDALKTKPSHLLLHRFIAALLTADCIADSVGETPGDFISHDNGNLSAVERQQDTPYFLWILLSPKVIGEKKGNRTETEEVKAEKGRMEIPLR